MDRQSWIAMLGFAGTLLLVLTGLLNFSVFVRQLRAAREQLDTAREQLEHAQQQPAIVLVQRALTESSEHLKVLVDRPHLRPYFYDDVPLVEEQSASAYEVKLVAELFLNTFASSLIHAATFPQYPARTVEQTIRFHLSSSDVMRNYLLEAFDRFPVAGLGLLVLKSSSRGEVEGDLEALVGRAQNLVERDRRARLLEYVRGQQALDPLELTRYTLGDGGLLDAERGVLGSGHATESTR